MDEPEVEAIIGTNQQVIEGVSFIGGFVGLIILLMIAQVIFLKTLENKIKKDKKDDTTVEMSEVKRKAGLSSNLDGTKDNT